jgi:hypothetical protein
MSCEQQRIVLDDEIKAWAAYHFLKDSGSKDEKELIRRYTNACDVSTRLKQHISACPECRPTIDQTT